MGGCPTEGCLAAGCALLRGALLGCVYLAEREHLFFTALPQSALCGCLGVWSRLGTGTLRSPPDERAERGVLPGARGWSGTS